MFHLNRYDIVHATICIDYDKTTNTHTYGFPIIVTWFIRYPI
jgi:hypothetical protein